jgi:diaphanous 1
MESLIVPTVLPSGSLHFASVAHHGTAQDVIDALAVVDDVKKEVLGDLLPAPWAIQRIRSEPAGRQWEEDELEALGDGPSPPPRFPLPPPLTLIARRHPPAADICRAAHQDRR